MKRFAAPEETLGALDAAAAAAVISAAADVALVIDGAGVVRDLALGGEAPAAAEWAGRWLGRPWIETVTVESRPKVEALLREAGDAGAAPPRWRHVNHPSPRGGPDLPVLYTTVRAGRPGRVVAVGRDLSATAALQQRLIEAQQSMERDYARLRLAEARYRLLFEATAEAVLIVDAAGLKVTEANPAAVRLLLGAGAGGAGKLVGRAFPAGFDATGTTALGALLATVRATGRPDEARARLAEGGRECRVAAALVRQEGGALFVVRLLPAAGDAGAADSALLPPERAGLADLVEGAPDAIAVTGGDGRIAYANAAFTDLAQLVSEERARGESLERWLGRPGVDLPVLLANLRQHGAVRLFATTMRGELGEVASIEVSAAAVPNAEPARYGFAIRPVGRRLQAEPRAARELPRSVEQLTELVGRVPLKDLVRETTDVIERLCIEAALDLTNDNRASAAEILGLSRQSLYVKLRRYGLGDLGPENGEAN